MIKSRWRTHLSIGVGDDVILQHAVRAHGNFTEYAPLFLIGMAINEFNGMAWWLLAAVGVLFFAGRLLHAYSLLVAEHKSKGHRFRISGMIMSFAGLTLQAILLVISAL